jgi:LPS-assembly protein
VTFERTHRLFDRAWLQTLEPRAFYVYTPYRDQNFLPNYDSGGNTFNFASVFAENAFGGSDRISDSKLLTLGAISRLLDPQTGAEGARFGLAQRLRMQDQRVVIPGDTTARAGISDILAGASLNLSRSWALDSTVQYNPKNENYSRRMVGGRYSPGSYRVINAAYRSQNNEDGSPASRQVDIGWQWPLHDLWGGQDESLGDGRGLGEGRWYSVARMNYSPLDHKVVESVIGFEYDAGCWLGRVVADRLQVTDGLSRQRLLFQLEFVGFSRVGTNALGSLRSNVPRYQPLRQNSMTPSRFGNYD